MFTRVIIATDLSEASDQIIINLAALHPLGTKEVILAHAMDIAPQSISAPGFDYNEALRGDLSRRAQARLEKLRDVIGAQGYEATARIIYGTPATAIDALARSTQASLVIAGSRGSSLGKNVVLGGSVMDILEHSRVPFLLKRLVRNDPGAPSKYRLLCRDFSKHLLHPTDFSPAAEQSFPFVERIARCCGSAVTLLHVCESEDRAACREATDRLEEKAGVLKAAGASEVTVQVKVGEPAREIVRTAQSPGISLLILGSQGNRFVNGSFLGSTCRNLVGTTTIPILTIPPRSVATPVHAPTAEIDQQKPLTLDSNI